MLKMYRWKEQEKAAKGQEIASKEKRPRLAFLVANTYENSKSQKKLPGTKKSMETVEPALKSHSFNTKLHINKPFDTVKKELQAWKHDALKDGSPEALLFYFCGHGGTACFFFSGPPTPL